MLTIKLDNIEITVPAGTTILKAAEKAGIIIPTMCFNESVPNHASCMVCAVKNNISGEFIPSCESKVQEGMDIKCSTPEVIEFRKDSLELLLSDHVGDCEAPCRVGCPAFMDIPQMNRLIAKGEFSKALEIVKEEIALPLILGYICSAPCEGACRRKQTGSSVTICQLKKFVALEDSKIGKYYLPDKLNKTGKKTAVIGAGLAGLSASFHLLKYGYSCVIFDKNKEAGGSLLNVPENELPKYILETEIEILKQLGAEFRLNSDVTFDLIKNDFDAVIIASGENSKYANLEINEDTFTTNESKLFACGAVMHPVKMAVRAGAQGKASAHSVHSFLSGKIPQKQKRQFNSRFGKLNEQEISEYMKESIPGESKEPQNGVLPGFNREEAIAEAMRCLRCDCRKSKTCKLRLNSDHYNVNQQKYKLAERNKIRKHFQKEILVYEPEKCIKCGLCIEIVKRNNDLTGLAYIGRGFDIHIDIPFNKPLEQAVADAAIDCINACPTSALSGFAGESGNVLPD